MATLLNLLLLTILMLALLLAILLLMAAFGRRRKQDRTLHAFEGYFVTVERRNGRIWSGILHLTTSGFEIRFPTAGSGNVPPAEASYIHYAVEYDALQALYRDVEGMGPEERKRRETDLRPENGRRLHTRWQDMLDTIEQGIAILTDREQVPLAVEIEGAGHNDMSGNRYLVGYVGNRHDPLLEGNLGQRMVCQLVVQDSVFERIGTLQAYSKRFLLLSDVLYPSARVLYLGREEHPRVETEVRLEQNGRRLEITNLSPYPLLLDDLRMGEKVKDLGMVLEPQQSFHVVLERTEEIDCELRCQIVRRLDIILPRARAVVRYRAGHEDNRHLFDIGIALSPTRASPEQEERLRWELRQHPHNATAAASLGRLLYRRGDFAEAEGFFVTALQQPQALPDNGIRVHYELEQLRRYRQSTPETPS